ncbi:hypothetical protein JQX09_24520 [Sulfitobacter pseudonitzschiae]|uniref:Uncharacterized protein n=1 Tax=Pseudosulfitobacter pseudonitzschiae TaxID=1402135 RepID=A0A9Q2NQP5_9RHOB|nr:hypothetical protein [Pseudosulfitobacter pseudonitzschiae]MBM2295087.1 hypothetical protein [Pseudosulfitobacter pseudonitzschiae]MBM2300017.1 hypothetical protein [Pseudosulfitobacter pseudonitzschiae]MBM2304925.1 hypothetical protein [Pseudosulfitobacter pseudonitzschiae]MBM2314698.1 hypothetical protein [Pseudosulfitobacter pseudonitzschiae]MBM2319606.1 hypothetical protein [Pseudosulfitobacter pseudonitzschiae]
MIGVNGDHALDQQLMFEFGFGAFYAGDGFETELGEILHHAHLFCAATDEEPGGKAARFGITNPVVLPGAVGDTITACGNVLEQRNSDLELGFSIFASHKARQRRSEQHHAHLAAPR